MAITLNKMKNDLLALMSRLDLRVDSDTSALRVANVSYYCISWRIMLKQGYAEAVK